MLSAYPACFFKEDCGYSVIFPGLNHLATCGSTLEEALAMSIDCLAGYLYWLKLDGEEMPKVLSISEISIEEIAKETYDNPSDYSEAFINMVTVDVEEYAKTHFNKSVKKTLTIPEWMNKQAIALDLNFSQILQEALLAKFQMLKQ